MPLVRSFPPLASKNARVLILGSMPGEVSLAAGQYYAHPRNAFWPIAGAVFGFDPRAPYRQRVAAMRARGVAVWDVLACCERDGSLDGDIAPASMQANDFGAFFARHRGVRDVCCNGGTAHRLFTARVLPAFPELRVHRLPSTSPAHAGMPFARKLATWRALLAGVVLALALPLCAQGEGGGKAKETPSEQVPGTPAAVAPAAAGAEVAYRRIAVLMREQFGDRLEKLPETEADPLGLGEASAVGKEWRAATAAAAPTFAQWRVAIAEPRCRFRVAGTEPLSTEFEGDLFLAMTRLEQLVIARGLQALADRDTDDAVSTVGGLLAHVRHLRQEPSMLAWSMAASLENQVGALHELLRERLGADASARSRAAITRHLESRAAVAALGAAARIGTFRAFDSSIAHMQLGKDATAEAARTLGTEIRRAFTALVDPMLAVAESTADAWTAERQESFAKCRAALIARKDERMRVLKALMAGKAPPADFDAAPDVALMLATLLIPSLDGVVAEHDKAAERLRAAIR